MKELSSKKNKSQPMYSLPVLIVMLVLVVLLVQAAWGVLGKERNSREKLQELEAKALELKVRQEELSFDLEYLDTEEGLTEEIRDRFSVAREGEMVAVLVSPLPETVEIEETRGPWYKRFWDVIMPPYGK